MRSLAFTPRWIGGGLFCLTAAAVCGFLGHWQWDVAQHGSLQNTAYAFNWWLFSALFIGFWFKALRDTAHRDAVGEGASAAAARMGPVSGPLPQLVPMAGRGLAGAALRLPREREPAPDVPRPPIPTAEEDPDVAAWNDWLAELNAEPKR